MVFEATRHRSLAKWAYTALLPSVNEALMERGGKLARADHPGRYTSLLLAELKELPTQGLVYRVVKIRI